MAATIQATDDPDVYRLIVDPRVVDRPVPGPTTELHDVLRKSWAAGDPKLEPWSAKRSDVFTITKSGTYDAQNINGDTLVRANNVKFVGSQFKGKVNVGDGLTGFGMEDCTVDGDGKNIALYGMKAEMNVLRTHLTNAGDLLRYGNGHFEDLLIDNIASQLEGFHSDGAQTSGGSASFLRVVFNVGNGTGNMKDENSCMMIGSEFNIPVLVSAKQCYFNGGQVNVNVSSVFMKGSKVDVSGIFGASKYNVGVKLNGNKTGVTYAGVMAADLATVRVE